MSGFEIIPAIDLRGGRCVRLRQGDFAAETQYDGDPVAVARRWQEEGGSRLHLVDLDGAAEGRPVNAALICRICAALSIPVQVGGGLRGLDAIDTLLEAGAERAILGTAAAADPALLEEACARHPGRIAVAIDRRSGRVAVRGWLEESEVDADSLAERAERAGAVAIVLTEIRRDGTGVGAAVEETVAFAARRKVPVIVSGGVASLEDVRRARDAYDAGANLGGVIIGRALYEGALRLADAALWAGPRRG